MTACSGRHRLLLHAGVRALAGFGILKATAHTKLLNFASNLGGFVVFAAVGAIPGRSA